jgi:hypothetical protein
VGLFFVITGGGLGGSTLSGNTSRSSLSVGRVDGKVNVLFRSRSHIKGWNGDQLGSNTDVALSDQDTGVVDGLGKALLVNLGLKTALKQLLGSQLKDGIQLEFIISQKSVSVHTTKKGRTLEDSLRILGVQGQQHTGGLSQLGQGVRHWPDFALATESVLSNKTKFGIQSFLFEWSTRSLEAF